MDSSSPGPVSGDGGEVPRNGNVPSMPLARPDSARSTRPSKEGGNLPDDLMAFDMQVATLLTFARLSDGRGPVNSAQVADALNVSPERASLSNGFFVDSGWLECVGLDQYVAKDAAVAYYRQIEAGSHPADVTVLAVPVESSWYWQSLAPSLNGRLSRYDALVILATQADTAPENRPRLERLLQWLEFLEMIKAEGDHIVGARAAHDIGSALAGQRPGTLMAAGPGAPSGKPEDPGPLVADAGCEDPVLTFSTELHLTGKDLARLEPDQIRALFEAVGTLASLMQRRP